MKNRLFKLLTIILACLFFIGCTGSRETDELAYVMAMGIDKGKHDRVRVTLQIAVPKNLSAGGGGGGGGAGGKPITIVSAEGPTTYACINLINTATSRQITTMHCKAIFYSEEMAREDISENVLLLARNREIRKTVFINIVTPSAEKYLSNLNPLFESLPPRFYELKSISQAETSLYELVTLKEFYEHMKSFSSDPVAMLIGVNDNKQEDKDRQVPKPEDFPSYLPGQIPRKADVTTENIGTAVFVGGKMVGKLNGDETRTLLMLQGKLQQGYYVMPDPKHPNLLITFRIKQGQAPDVQLDLKNNVIRQTIYLEGEFANIQSGENYEEPRLKRQFEEQFNLLTKQKCDQLLEKLQQNWHADAVGYGDYARHEFLTFQELEKARWLSRIYPDINIEVNVKTVIRRTGLITSTTPVPEQKWR